MKIIYLVIAALLTGCVSSSQTYTSDGAAGYTVSCHGAMVTWNSCHSKAGKLCGARGYTIDSDSRSTGRDTDADILVASENEGVMRSMVIACKS